MARLLLLRHGQSEWNAAGLWQGAADPPLTPHGEEQARAAARWLAHSGLTAVVTSDLQRARRTGEVIAAELGLPMLPVEAGLRERDVGEWSGHTTDEVMVKWPGQLEAWRAGALERPPGGERNADFGARVMAAVERLADRAEDEVLLVVTHGGVIHTVGSLLGAQWHGVYNLTGWWVEHGPAPGVRAVPPEGDEITAAVTTLL
jgi:broad specificity phosphatase PhoE